MSTTTTVSYIHQDVYKRQLPDHAALAAKRAPRAFRAAILENEFLRAVFLPELGGRLWSLFDKKAGRELLYVNDAVRYCNCLLYTSKPTAIMSISGPRRGRR